MTSSFNNFTGSQRSCGKVMFSVICVCLSVYLSVCLFARGGAVQGPGPHVQGFSSIPMRHVQTGSTWTSLDRAPRTSSNLKHAWLSSGQLVSYRNAFLCSLVFILKTSQFHLLIYSQNIMKMLNVTIEFVIFTELALYILLFHQF